MKRAVISDIHANLEALEAVLADIRGQGLNEIFCLGDIVGYGPNPCECIDLVIQNCDMTLLGNHDEGALFDPQCFNSVAERAIFWTRDQLESANGSPEASAKRWDFLGELPRNHREGERLYVHGSPRRPLSEYVFPEDVFNAKKIESIFTYVQKYCFQGHTHVPGVFLDRPTFFSPADVNYEYTLGTEKAMINVGSVGQPRDGDPRACYVLLDDHDGKGPLTVRWRRVDYPVETTIKKIYNVDDLDDSLGDRLREGR